jgi:hypothetical protein
MGYFLPFPLLLSFGFLPVHPASGMQKIQNPLYVVWWQMMVSRYYSYGSKEAVGRM